MVCRDFKRNTLRSKHSILPHSACSSPYTSTSPHKPNILKASLPPTPVSLIPPTSQSAKFPVYFPKTSLVLLFPLSFLPDLILQTWPITAPRLTHAKCLLEIIIKPKWDHFAPLLTQQSTAYWKTSKLPEMPGGALRTPASSPAAPCLGCCRPTTYLHVSQLLSPHTVPHPSTLLSLLHLQHPLLLADLQLILQNSNWMSLSPGNLP